MTLAKIRPAVLAMTLLWAGMADADPRIALVIGNGAYEESPLSNAVNDAQAMKAALEKLGFTVVYLENADRPAMDRAVREFTEQLQPDSEGLFYFSGHGAQAGGANYLVPLRADIASEAELTARAYDVGIVLDNMRQRGNRLNLIILDACRNNPFKGFKAAADGLANMHGPEGSLIAFASAPGTVASNNRRESNSTYTKHLLRHISEPGMKIEEMLKEVRQGVSEDSRKHQIPWENSSLLGDFCFAGCKSAAESEAEAKLRAAEARIRELEAVRQNTPPTTPANPAPAAKPPTTVDYGIEMVTIPAGTFGMGCGPKEAGCDDDEKPRHQVGVAAFAMGKTEVTQGQWRAVMGSNPSHFKQCGDNCPVEQVSWDDAQAFIAKLNRQTSGGYRLPSEAEWEYAARAGTTTAFSTGDCINTRQANYDGTVDYNGCGAKTGVWLQKPQPVGRYPANPWGLLDMHGNVYEWVQDCYHDRYQGAPADGTAREDGATCADGLRVLRGGSWFNYPRVLRSANRFRNDAGGRGNSIGFRLARTLTP